MDKVWCQQIHATYVNSLPNIKHFTAINIQLIWSNTKAKIKVFVLQDPFLRMCFHHFSEVVKILCDNLV